MNTTTDTNRNDAGAAIGRRMRIIGEIGAAAIVAAMFGWAAFAWSSAPERIPMHWNLSGEIDRYGGRFEGMLAIPLIALAVYLGLTFLPRIDPGRENYATFAGAYTLVRVTLAAIFGTVYVIIQSASRGRSVDVAFVLGIGLGVFFVVLGNVMGKLRPNWFVGIRTPWTMSSAESWNRTHRAGGWVFVTIGILTMAAGFVGGKAALPIAMALLLLATAGLVIYSYRVWRSDPEKVPPAGRTPA